MLIEIKEHLNTPLETLINDKGYKPSNTVLLNSIKGVRPVIYSVYIPNIPGLCVNKHSGKTLFSTVSTAFQKLLPEHAFVSKIALPIYDNRDSMMSIIAESLGIKNTDVMDKANSKLLVKEL